MKKPTDTPREEWKKELKKQFPDRDLRIDGFIRQELSRQREEMRKSMKEKSYWYWIATDGDIEVVPLSDVFAVIGGEK